MRSLIVSFAILATTSHVWAQDAKSERVISVTGAATVYARPDTARVHYGVKVTEPTGDALKEVLGKTNAAIDEAVKKLKLTNVKVSAGPLAMRQSSGNNGGPGIAVQVPGGAPAAPAPGLGPFVGATGHTATITDADPEKLRAAVDAFIKAITEAGANTSGGDIKEMNPNFFPNFEGGDGPKIVMARSDDSAARDEALKIAVKKAVKNAKAIAEALGGGEVKVISVTDVEAEKTSSGPESPLSAIYGLEMGGSGQKVPAGEIEIKVRVVVKVSY